MTRQKSKFWTFVFSLVPGCGHLFMGFRRRGLAFLLIFAGVIVVCVALDARLLAVAGSFVVLAYSFFDALNLNSAPPEAFAKQPDGLSEFTGAGTARLFTAEKFRRYAGVALLVFAVVVVWNMVVPDVINSWYSETTMDTYNLLWRINDIIPRAVVSVIAVVVGLRLISGKKKALESADAGTPV